jgi:hypothetical protein
VWTVATSPYADAHFAVFPPNLIKPCVLAGAPVNGVVLDPFAGAGTTLYVAKELGRQAVGIELNPAYCTLAARRLRQSVLPFAPASEPLRAAKPPEGAPTITPSREAERAACDPAGKEGAP